jgi:hypothetical protein
MRLRVLAVMAGLLLTGAAFAQEAVLRAPDGGTSHHVDGVDLLAIPDKPLSGKSSIEWTRTLADGSVFAVSGLANLARDSQGRMYRERRDWVPAGSGRENPLIEKQYYGPLEKTKTVCTMRLKQCIVTDYRPRTRLMAMPAAASTGGGRTVARESLGSNVVEGVDVTGTRETTTIDPGVLGNAKTMIVTREFWYSPELETNLTVTRNDPRDGRQIVRLVDLSRGEPDPQIFQLPSGFEVIDARAGASTAAEK